MSDEKKESRVKVEDLPQQEREIGPQEAGEVRGGGAETGDGKLLGNLLTAVDRKSVSGDNTWTGPVTVKDE